MLLESILFLTLKIKQNKFTKLFIRCEFDNLKIKIKTFGGAPAFSVMPEVVESYKNTLFLPLVLNFIDGLYTMYLGNMQIPRLDY